MLQSTQTTQNQPVPLPIQPTQHQVTQSQFAPMNQNQTPKQPIPLPSTNQPIPITPSQQPMNQMNQNQSQPVPLPSPMTQMNQPKPIPLQSQNQPTVGQMNLTGPSMPSGPTVQPIPLQPQNQFNFVPKAIPSNQPLPQFEKK